MTLLFLFAALALGISFLCSLLEACLLSVPRSYIESLVEQGSRGGLVLLRMRENINRPLAAILTLNTIAHTLGAAGVGAQATKVFGDAGVGIASAIMTLLILLLSEIIPKTLGAVHAKRIAVPSAYVIQGLILVCLPVIVPLEWINRRIGLQPQRDLLSRAEILSTLRLGHASGAMRRREYEIATNLIGLRSIHLSDVLTPRTVVFSLPEEMTVGEVLEKHEPLRFNRIPVYAGDHERVTGYAPRFEIYAASAAGKRDTPLKELSKDAPFFPEQATVRDALDAMLKDRQHIATVVDEYGGMAGIVTLEDLLESLLGEEIVDETDAVADMQELARRRRGRRG